MIKHIAGSVDARDLYMRAQGCGRPVTPEEVVQFIEDTRTYEEQGESLSREYEGKIAELRKEVEALEKRALPETDPERPCSMCTSQGDNRGDGRCERHGRWIGANSPLALMAAERDAAIAERNALAFKLGQVAELCGAADAREAQRRADIERERMRLVVQSCNATIEQQRAELARLTTPRRRRTRRGASCSTAT